MSQVMVINCISSSRLVRVIATKCFEMKKKRKKKVEAEKKVALSERLEKTSSLLLEEFKLCSTNC